MSLFFNNFNNIGTKLDYNVFPVYLVVAMIPEAAVCLVDNSYKIATQGLKLIPSLSYTS